MNGIRQFLLYVVVGAIATVVEWVCFWVLNNALHLHYVPATCLAFVVSTFANWLAGRLLLFKETDKSLGAELVQIYATSIAGLLMNLAIMWVAVEHVGLDAMIAKIVATGIVFFWNFLVRKLLIYKV